MQEIKKKEEEGIAGTGSRTIFNYSLNMKLFSTQQISWDNWLLSGAY